MNDLALGLKEGFSSVFDRLERMVDDTAVDLDWRPEASWNSAAVLIKHICASSVGLAAVAAAGAQHNVASHDEQFAEGGADRSALRALVSDSRQAVAAALDTALDPDENVAVWGREMPRRTVQVNALTHANQHIGQLNLLKRVAKAAVR